MTEIIDFNSKKQKEPDELDNFIVQQMHNGQIRKISLKQLVIDQLEKGGLKKQN